MGRSRGLHLFETIGIAGVKKLVLHLAFSQINENLFN